MRVLGVDAYRRGWVGITLGERIEAYAAATIAELVAEAGPVEVIGIDIPIGLSTSDMRSADEQAQLAAGPRRSSVFLTPVRAALHAPTHAEAVEVNRAATGKGVSIQAYGLRAKILEVDAWVPAAPARVVEVHPELSFAELAGGVPLAEPKATWAGAVRRRRLLEDAGIALPDDLGPVGRAGTDDVLDAAAAAWSAARVAAGRARSLPDPPELLHGIAAAIWT